MSGSDPSSDRIRPSVGANWRARGVLVVFLALSIAVVWITNILMTDRITATTRNKAEVRLALFSGNLLSELRRTAVVPLLLARDQALIIALESGDFSSSSQRLISYIEEIGAEGFQLLDNEGRVVAATDRSSIGQNLRSSRAFVEAKRADDTVFAAEQNEYGSTDFTYSRRVIRDGNNVGVIIVRVNLSQFEQSWAGISDAVMVTDSEGTIILTTEPQWRGKTVEEALFIRSNNSSIQRAIQATTDWAALPADAYLQGEAVMRNSARIPFQGWRLVSFTSYAPVREQVNAVLALEIMGFALLLAAGFYVLSRRAQSRSRFFQQETAELRELNARLQKEIADRERAEQHLEVAEQSLAQSSKLAALGEMSAAVSHELNQPLAAMKTYLAGARLLLQRNRPDEALASFLRIDDLIERMGAITRQLKSYARKGEDAFAPMDYKAAVSSALAMMEPQLKHRKVKITRTFPPEPVMVMGDRIRLEQVIINLLRNALDATKQSPDAQIDLILSAGETAKLTVRDNGEGIEDLDSLFEPFYTTKAPGDGTGLGLAISSGIVTDHGGRLTAREGRGGGAVFEVQLPILHQEKTEAAE